MSNHVISERKLINWRVLFFSGACFALIIWPASLAQDLIIYRLAHPVQNHKIWLLDVDSEQSVYTWISVQVLFVAACLLLLLARETHLSKGKFVFQWYLLSFLFLLLSLDELIGIHEKISHYISTHIDGMTGLLHYSWAAPAIALSVVGFILYLPFVRSFPPRISLQLTLSALIYVGGAAGVEMLSGDWAETQGQDNLKYHLLADVEEGMEVLGVMVFIHALSIYRERRPNKAMH